MTRPFRFLGAANSSAAASIQPQIASTQPQAASVDSDFVVILAALLCALICVLGLIAVARCAWLRRVSSTNPQPPQPPSAANKGLKKKILRSLPKQSFSSELDTKVSECAICLSEFAAGEEIRILPQCGHGFHVSCIDTWLGSHSSCPSCRQILVVTRCQKCGGLPPTSNRVGVVAESSSSEACSKERGDNGNNFLP